MEIPRKIHFFSKFRHADKNLVSKTEKRVEVPGGEVYTCAFLQNIPKGRLSLRRRGMKLGLLMIHGGPGYPHNYLLGLSALGDLLPVIFYDQLGCGQSRISGNGSLWRISRFVEEIEAIRQAYQCDALILHGHSWGTILAIEYALRYPERLKGLVLESPCLSIPRWKEDAAILIGTLSEDQQKIISEAQKDYQFHTPEFINAVDEYYKRYVHPARPKPEVLLTCEAGAGTDVYTSLWGPCEFILTGSLRDYDRSDSLNGINVPVLFTAGEFDEVRPETLVSYVKEVEGSQYQIFSAAHHFPHLECEEEYIQLMKSFLLPIVKESINA